MHRGHPRARGHFPREQGLRRRDGRRDLLLLRLRLLALPSLRLRRRAKADRLSPSQDDTAVLRGRPTTDCWRHECRHSRRNRAMPRVLCRCVTRLSCRRLRCGTLSERFRGYGSDCRQACWRCHCVLDCERRARPLLLPRGVWRARLGREIVHGLVTPRVCLGVVGGPLRMCAWNAFSAIAAGYWRHVRRRRPAERRLSRVLTLKLLTPRVRH